MTRHLAIITHWRGTIPTLREPGVTDKCWNEAFYPGEMDFRTGPCAIEHKDGAMIRSLLPTAPSEALLILRADSGGIHIPGAAPAILMTYQFGDK